MDAHINNLIASAFALADKREAAYKRVTPCPVCGTDQVQLIDWLSIIAWKCRKCKHTWKDNDGRPN